MTTVGDAGAAWARLASCWARSLLMFRLVLLEQLSNTLRRTCVCARPHTSLDPAPIGVSRRQNDDRVWCLGYGTWATIVMRIDSSVYLAPVAPPDYPRPAPREDRNSLVDSPAAA